MGAVEIETLCNISLLSGNILANTMESATLKEVR